MENKVSKHRTSGPKVEEAYEGPARAPAVAIIEIVVNATAVPAATKDSLGFGNDDRCGCASAVDYLHGN
jgi:hypothetical protein